MVFHRIDEQGWTTKVLEDLRHVGVEGIPDGIRQYALAMLRAEYQMDVQTGKGLGHKLARPFRARRFGAGCSQGVALV
jgi:hypothetical protein